MPTTRIHRRAMAEASRYAIAMAIACFIASPASGQTTVTWNGSDAGNANWSVAGNWTSGTAPSGSVALVFGSGGSATTSFNDIANLTVTSGSFGGLARTITGSAITLGGNLTYNVNGLSTIGFDMTLSANRTFAIGSGTLALTGVISGSTFNKTQAGTLRLTAANTFTGAVNIQRGAVEVTVLANTGVASSLGTSGTITLGSNLIPGTLRYLGTSNASTDRPFRVGGQGENGLENDGTGTLTLTNPAFNSAATTSASTAIIFALQGSNAGSNEIQGAIADNGAKTISVSKAGSGRWVLSGVNSYTGATSVTAGTLQIGPTGSINSTSGITIDGASAELKYNSATALTKALTLTQGTISGTGTIGTAVTFASGDFLSPGNSPGEQRYTSLLDWDPLGTYRWELNSLAGTAGTNWDLVNVTSGTFDLSGLSAGAGGKFVLDLITLATDNSSGPLATPYSGGSHMFRIANYDPNNFLLPTGFTNTANADLTGLFSISLANWQGTKPDAGNISVRINSATNGIDLVIVPEPGTVIFAGIGIAMAGWSLWKRRRLAHILRK